MNFFDALDVESKLKDSMDSYIKEMMREPIMELIVHSKRSGWYRCPICFKGFSNDGKGVPCDGFAKMLRHFRWKANRWEFLRLIKNVETIPRAIEYRQHDFLYEEAASLHALVRKWVVCVKILHYLNPNTIKINYDVSPKVKEVQSVL